MRNAGLKIAGMTLAAALWTGATATVAAPAAQPAQAAQGGWSTYQAPEGDFSALFPGAPQATSQPMGAMAGAVQRSYAIQSGPEAFNVTVFAYPKGTLPPTMSKDQLDNLAKLFGEGSGMKVRSSTAASVSGRPGVEAVLDDPETGAVMIFRAAQLGDRVFVIAYGGAKGSETSPQATRFVGSLQIRK